MENEELFDTVKDIVKVNEGDPWKKITLIPEVLYFLRENKRNEARKLSKEKMMLAYEEGKLKKEIVEKPASHGIDTKGKKPSILDIQAAIDRNLKVVKKRETVIDLELEYSTWDDLIQDMVGTQFILKSIIGDEEAHKRATVGTSLSMADRRELRKADK